MTIQARYSGVCPDCEERWQPGDLIRLRVVGYEHMERWVHDHCPGPTTDHLIGKPCDPCCTDCWASPSMQQRNTRRVHPEGACDR